ncbi:hypothetical protein JXR93_14565 [bacterium]|nr:hypothetical protein [bacterium]
MKKTVLFSIFLVVLSSCTSQKETTNTTPQKPLYSCDKDTDTCSISDPFRVFIEDIKKCATSPTPILKKNIEGDAFYVRGVERYGNSIRHNITVEIAKYLHEYLMVVKDEYYKEFKEDIEKNISEFVKQTTEESADSKYEKIFIEAQLTGVSELANHPSSNGELKCFYFNFNKFVIENIQSQLPETFKSNRKKYQEIALKKIQSIEHKKDSINIPQDEMDTILGNWDRFSKVDEDQIRAERRKQEADEEQIRSENKKKEAIETEERIKKFKKKEAERKKNDPYAF